jgi:hypothetical protein
MECTEKSPFMAHAEFAVLLITLISGFYLLDGKIERANERTDKVYEMFMTIHDEIKDLHGRACAIEARIDK